MKSGDDARASVRRKAGAAAPRSGGFHDLPPRPQSGLCLAQLIARAGQFGNTLANTIPAHNKRTQVIRAQPNSPQQTR